MTLLFDNELQIPSSIWFAILSFLDCLDVIKLSLVSKNWYRSIRNPEFANFYSEFGPKSSRQILLQGVSPLAIKYDKTFILISEEIDFDHHQTVLVPHINIGSKHGYELIGSIRGILCLQSWNHHDQCVFVMCNPITTQIF